MVQRPISQGIHVDEAFVEQVARRVFAEMIAQMRPQQIQGVPDEERPPDPQLRTRKKGRKELREYDKFTVTIDKVLAERFREEMKSKRLSAGRLLDQILWLRYGKPALSYMKTSTQAFQP